MTSFSNILDCYDIAYKRPGEHEHCTPGWLQIDCPWCSPKDAGWFRLGYNLAGSYLSCWTCGYHPLAWTVCEIVGETYPVVKELLGGLDRDEWKERKAVRGGLVIPGGVGALLPRHEDYLVGRGFDPTYVSKMWGVLGIGIARRLSWRLFIPIHKDGAVVSWTTRSLSDSGRSKYVSAGAGEEAVAHKSLLYGEDRCRHATIVCEGPTDVWKVGPGAVATFGVQVSQAQILRISKFPVRAICFDSDASGMAAAAKLVKDLACFPGQTFNVTLKDKDPGSSGEIDELRRSLLE